MYKMWSKEDVKKVLSEMSKKMGEDCGYVHLAISLKIKPPIGKCRMTKKKVNGKKIVIGDLFIFSASLLDGSYTEEHVRHVIIHQYIHFYTSVKANEMLGHTEEFRRNCERVGISPDPYKPEQRIEATESF